MATLDIINNDAFSVTNLTKAMIDEPLVPTRIRELGWFSEEGITSESFFIERIGTTVSLVPTSNPGTGGDVVNPERRSIISFNTVHLQQRATIMSGEISNVRSFGSETQLETVQAVVQKRLSKMRRNLDVTIEWHQIGAIKGQVLDADGTTVLLDMFSAFGVAQQTHNMELDNPASIIRGNIIAAKRKAEYALGGLMSTGYRVLCSPGFFDKFTDHPGTAAAFNRWMDGQFFRDDVRKGFFFGGIFWEEYYGKVGSTEFIPDGQAYLVPEGVPDLFVMYFSPAQYMETANTIGLPYYAKTEPMPMNKGVVIESQSNPIALCTRPRAIIKLTAS
jgi:Phage major capsid protein E